MSKKDNKLIAEFFVKGTDEELVLKNDLKKAGTIESMQYDTSWDWLMPVVDKIESLLFPNDTYYEVIQLGGNIVVVIDNNGKDLCYMDNKGTRLDNTYKAVVKFIKWYNK